MLCYLEDMNELEGYTEHDFPGGKLFILTHDLYAQLQSFLEDANLQHLFTYTGEDYD